MTEELWWNLVRSCSSGVLSVTEKLLDLYDVGCDGQVVVKGHWVCGDCGWGWECMLLDV